MCQLQISAAEAAWLAGILEGEACFDFAGDGKYPRIRIEMKDEDVIQRVKDLCQGGGEIRRNQRANVNHSDTYAFAVYERSQVKAVLETIMPWLGRRRAARAEELLDHL